ncbi:hypothetical protein RISK_001393 [Rhodopirellula islandica]|uniref:Uncharacterized protein n=1 Tax=Rhodopirellula islandica TaxID=595434 RepID=A0A0J1BJN8_RHOIS|nr:hypothetical protein RISK_001393 [Rhodopirellula islandica]
MLLVEENRRTLGSCTTWACPTSVPAINSNQAAKIMEMSRCQQGPSPLPQCLDALQLRNIVLAILNSPA